MAYLVVEKDGSEYILDDEPIRDESCGEWSIGFNNIYFVELPKGSIFKLIGRKLTWDDEPVEI